MKRSIAFRMWNSENLSRDSLTNLDVDIKKKASRWNSTFVARIDSLEVINQVLFAS